MSMANDATFYRDQAAKERHIADTTDLIMVRVRALHAAEKWDELAARTERAIASAAVRRGDE